MNNEQLLLMLIGEKEREIALSKMLIKQQSEEIKRLQAQAPAPQKGAEPPHPGS